MAAERYHGSATRAAVHDFFRAMAGGLKGLRGVGRNTPAGPSTTEVDGLLDRVAQAAGANDQHAALTLARQASRLVIHGGTTAQAVGSWLVRLGDCRQGLRLIASAADLSETTAAKWAGEDLTARELWILQRTSADMGAAIRLARFVACAEQRGARCTVAVERRLVPIFARTFPNAMVTAKPDKRLPNIPANAVVTTLEALAGECVTDFESVLAGFLPLQADQGIVSQLRQSYGGARRPVIGLTWGSENTRKEVPAIADWAGMVQSLPATFVSLQYGPVSPAVRALRGNHPDKFVYDSSVDQMVDMDRFAAQVAALDGVLAISNTAAHLSGALGIPTVIIGGDSFTGQLPAFRSDSGWYPSAVQVRKRGRPWPVVLEEAGVRLSGMIAQAPIGA